MSNTLMAILWGGASCAILDGAASTVAFGLKGVKPPQVWQGVASGLLGPESFRRGNASVTLGLLFHCLIAFVAAAVFTEVSPHFPFLVVHYLISGAVFGVMVFLAMNVMVIPLSAMAKRPVTLQGVITQVIIHIVCVGLPIAIAASRYLN
jgi:uncharacterized membrane protein YagU involved in acid resistance